MAATPHSEQKQDQTNEEMAIDEKSLQEGFDYERYEVESHTLHIMEEDAEEMALEGEHIEEDISDEDKISSVFEEDSERMSAKGSNVEES